jgi:hypothetical protein
MSPRRNCEIGTLPTPLSPASVPLPPEPGGGGANSPAVEWLGESQFRRLEKKLNSAYSVVLQLLFYFKRLITNVVFLPDHQHALSLLFYFERVITNVVFLLRQHAL